MTDDANRLLDSLLDRVRDDDEARQEFLDLLETLGPDDPTDLALPQGAVGPTVLMLELRARARRSYDLTHRALVMGILNRTPDSFYDKGLTFELDALSARGPSSWWRRGPTSSTWAG